MSCPLGYMLFNLSTISEAITGKLYHWMFFVSFFLDCIEINKFLMKGSFARVGIYLLHLLIALFILRSLKKLKYEFNWIPPVNLSKPALMKMLTSFSLWPLDGSQLPLHASGGRMGIPLCCTWHSLAAAHL